MRKNDIKVGFFLTQRYIRGSNPWTSALIVFVMVLTFLNLTVIGGILEGIIIGSFEGLRDRAIGDIYISPKTEEIFVDRSQHILAALKSDPRVSSVAPRLSTRVEVISEDEFFNVTNANDKRQSLSTTALGIDPEAEKLTTKLDTHLLEGEYLGVNSSRREVLIGSALIKRYSPFGADVLSDIYPGDFVYIRLGANSADAFSFDNDNENAQPVAVLASRDTPSGILQKYLVRGIFRTKAGELDLSIIMDAAAIRGHIKNPGNNVNGIAVRLIDATDALALQKSLLDKGFGRYATIETVQEAVGSFLDDIRTVFGILGNVVGSIALIVSSITIFIIIFVTAVSRQKYIGILKAIGVTPSAIRFSYMLYALSFALVGIIIGLLILYLLLVPFFVANPIPFPFSDGILYTTPLRTTIYTAIMLGATIIAGFIPAHRIVQKPAIDAVRGR